MASEARSIGRWRNSVNRSHLDGCAQAKPVVRKDEATTRSTMNRIVDWRTPRNVYSVAHAVTQLVKQLRDT